MTVHNKKSMYGIVGINSKPYPYNKASQNYDWRIYTYGLPRFLLDLLGHGIQPIRYKMLKRMDPLICQELTFGSVLIKIISQGLALSYMICIKNIFEL